jgi:hypothetical protein
MLAASAIHTATLAMRQPLSRSIATAIVSAFLLTPGCASAQHAGAGSAALPATVPAREAAQWDFLVGQWELEVTPKVSGLAAALHGAPRLGGIWKAWRAFDGFGVMDDLRIVDASGNPMALTHTLRIWDERARRWLLQSLDVYRARIGSGQAQWQEGEMRVQGSGTSPEGKPTLTRTRFSAIGPNGFRMQQDRSSDNGASWDEGVLTIVARRTAAQAPR